MTLTENLITAAGRSTSKVSKGSADKSQVEFELVSNSELKQNLKHQVDVYEAANDTEKSIKAILYFNDTDARLS
jgi:hypothetical protein